MLSIHYILQPALGPGTPSSVLVTTQANALQLQASGLDTLANQRSEDRHSLLDKNAALEQEVEELKQTVMRLDGEFSVLLARVESLEWTAPSEYLSVDNLGLRSDFRELASPSPGVEVEAEEPTVVPPENAVPVPILPPGLVPRRTVVESTTTLRPIDEEEARAIEDRLVGAWQRQGVDNVTPIILVGSGSNETSSPSCDKPVVASSREQTGIPSPEARGYRMLSVMRAVTMMPNTTVSTCLLSSDFVGGELQLVFPISQEEFDLLALGEMEAEVRPVVVSEVVRSGAGDDELEYKDEL
ncbi:hypothetical protein BDM02DRAFT_3191996 [Thelephora ganbajun]|uniref:Uncharacterized protein n=1 Tax=Thelephora ganbajun TaxID=370292 RepID=A0ACB6Z276_THEGA|nr:hypothetical protein BDM02DRAFT_3191996 [Thelephora ganbajun]